MTEEGTQVPSELELVFQRGMITRHVVANFGEVIARWMGKLPPPWEWQGIREGANLSVSDMEILSGINQNRIRLWEKGQGTNLPQQWIRYAQALTDTVQYIRDHGEAPEPIRELYRERVKRPVVYEFEDQGAVTQYEAVRGIIVSLEAWQASNQLDKYSDQDLENMLQVVRQGKSAFILAYNALRKEQENRKEQAK